MKFIRLVYLKNDLIRSSDLLIVVDKESNGAAFFRDSCSSFTCSRTDIDRLSQGEKSVPVNASAADVIVVDEKGRILFACAGNFNNIRASLKEAGFYGILEQAVSSLHVGKGEWISALFPELNVLAQPLTPPKTAPQTLPENNPQPPSGEAPKPKN